jgi:hypothetical protein
MQKGMDVEKQKDSNNAQTQNSSNKSNHALLNRIKSGKVIGTLLFSTNKKYTIEGHEFFQTPDSKKLHFMIVYTEDS